MSRGGGCNIEGERGLGGEGRSGQWLINYLKQHYWCYEDILHPSARKHYSSHFKKEYIYVHIYNKFFTRQKEIYLYVHIYNKVKKHRGWCRFYEDEGIEGTDGVRGRRQRERERERERDEGERLLYINTSSTYNKDDICSCS